MKIARTVAEVRAARATLGRLGFVPTMGALHDGHMSLMAAARDGCDAVAASIFVNPTQFGPNEDLSRYPRPIEADIARLEAAGVEMLFLPTVDIVYPHGFDTRIEVGAIANRLEGAVRPGHFSGVATVVNKLFNIVAPDVAWFGQKDVQQTRVILQMVRDLDLPVEIRIGATLREADGLALSSRNVYLSAGDRAEAVALYRGLAAAEAAWAGGEARTATLRSLIATEIATTGGVVDYISIADGDTLEELDAVPDAGAVMSLAVRYGTTRLIDNLVLAPRAAR
ncbi:pantoate--beta-alanine ligase [Sphingomonas sp. AP4-R1]|uniref:pantoate--beta-alanine ligase n=1 Tax=Sphingomonas sp. AP4-R1 TaxID=2735134 RepID=UPI001493D4E3|nr:pantoate--beta-alanine ligase [Sphingomonas sp. AP4-R1]QJU58712.1 pantoate--beta-alanine ligase [Sphingomonas sp. AP4-R1]